MAKSINWQKVQDNHKLYKQQKEDIENKDYRKQDNYHMRKNGLWAVKGKHYGKPLNKLTNNYLLWWIDKYGPKGMIGQIVMKELQRRHAEATNTSNT